MFLILISYILFWVWNQTLLKVAAISASIDRWLQMGLLHLDYFIEDAKVVDIKVYFRGLFQQLPPQK